MTFFGFSSKSETRRFLTSFRRFIRIFFIVSFALPSNHDPGSKRLYRFFLFFGDFSSTSAAERDRGETEVKIFET